MYRRGFKLPKFREHLRVSVGHFALSPSVSNTETYVTDSLQEPILDQPPMPSPRTYSNNGAPMFKSAEEVSSRLGKKDRARHFLS